MLLEVVDIGGADVCDHVSRIHNSISQQHGSHCPSLTHTVCVQVVCMWHVVSRHTLSAAGHGLLGIHDPPMDMKSTLMRMRTSQIRKGHDNTIGH